MSVPHFSQTATLLSSGKILVIGGNNGGVAIASAEIFDPATGAFSATGFLSGARYSHASTLLTNGQVRVTMRSSGSGPLSSAELYNPLTGTFSPTGSTSTAPGSAILQTIAPVQLRSAQMMRWRKPALPASPGTDVSL